MLDVQLNAERYHVEITEDNEKQGTSLEGLENLTEVDLCEPLTRVI